MEPLRDPDGRGGVPGVRGAGRGVAVEWMTMPQEEFSRRFKNSPIKRTEAPWALAQRRGRARQLGRARGRPCARGHAERRGTAGAGMRPGRAGAKSERSGLCRCYPPVSRLRPTSGCAMRSRPAFGPQRNDSFGTSCPSFSSFREGDRPSSLTHLLPAVSNQ